MGWRTKMALRQVGTRRRLEKVPREPRLLATAGVGGSKAGGETHGRFEDQDGALRAAGYVAAAGGGGAGSSRTLTFPGDKIREALDVFVAVAGEFIFIYVWAIRMTTCFVYRV